MCTLEMNGDVGEVVTPDYSSDCPWTAVSDAL